MDIKGLISMETLLKGGGLSAGAIASRFAKTDKIGGVLFSTKVGDERVPDPEKIKKYVPPIVFLAGLLLSQQKSTPILVALGNGLVADAGADIIAGFIDKDGSIGINGNDPFLGDPFLNNLDGQYTMNGTSYDFTSAGIDEMKY